MNIKVVSEAEVIREVVSNIIIENFETNKLEAVGNLNNIYINGIEDIDLLCIIIEKSQIEELKLLQKIKNKKSDIKIMLMDLDSGRNLLSEVIKYDIDGYINSNLKKDELISVIKIIIGGKKYYDGNSIIETIGKYNYYRSYKLTEREKEILNCIVDGLDNKDIANSLYISENTVKKHVSSILGKLNFKNRKQAIVQIKKYGMA